MIRFLELRTEKGLSQRDVAKAMYVSQGTYNNWENGKTQPSIEQLIRLAHFFEVSVDYLIGNTDELGTVNAQSSVTSAERTLLKGYRSLSEKGQTGLLRLLEEVWNK